MGTAPRPIAGERVVKITAGGVTLDGTLVLPERSRAIVLFAHGSGSSRFSPRNRFVARMLSDAGLATLLFDLLTPDEELIDLKTRQLRFDIGLPCRAARRCNRLGRTESRYRPLEGGLFWLQHGSCCRPARGSGAAGGCRRDRLARWTPGFGRAGASPRPGTHPPDRRRKGFWGY